MTATSTSTTPTHAQAAPPMAWLMLGTFVVTFDFFAVNVTVPTLRDALRADAAQLQWVVAAFGLLYGSALIAGSRLGDRHGTERVYAAGMALFAGASLAAVAAPGLGWLIAARCVQGVAAALLTPQVLALAGRIADPARRQRAFVAYGAALGLGAGLGPLVGAALIELDPYGLGWRAVFLPQVILAAAGALRAASWSGPPGRGPAIDLASVALLTASTMLLVVPLIEGRRLDWAAWLACLPLAAAAGLAVFWRRQKALAAGRGGALVDPALLQPRFTAALATVLCFYCSNASCILVVMFTLREVFQLRPLAAAGVYSVMSVGFIATTFGARRWFERFGDRPLALGAWALAAAQLLIAWQLHAGAALWSLLPTLLLAGAAFGVLMSPLVARSVGVAPLSQAGLASGVVVTVQWLGNALGVAVLGTIYFTLAADSLALAGSVVHALLAALAAGVALLLPGWLPRAARAVAR